MIWKIMHVIGALAGFVLGLGAGVSVNHISSPSIASAPSPIGVVLRLTFSDAHAGDLRHMKSNNWCRANQKYCARMRKGSKKHRRLEAEAKAEKVEKELVGTWTANLPEDCAYDSLASATQGTDIYSCGGMYYQRFEENGVVSYKGHAIGLDPGEVKKARARKAEAEKKAREEAKKKRQANRKTELPGNCYYDAQASALKGTDLYSCDGVYYRKYSERGVTGFEPSKP